jgi:molybdopterin-guanine dinucleotide biosynthesis protein A
VSGQVIGIVLAGGRSRRFGSNKLAAELDGRPLLHHAIDAIAAVADHVILVLAPGSAVPALPPSVDGRLFVARDRLEDAGPLAGLVAGLQAIGEAPGGSAGDDDLALVVGGDMPTLDPLVLGLLIEALRADPRLTAVTLEATGPAPLPLAVRHRAGVVGEQLLESGRRSLLGLIDAVPAMQVPAEAWRALDPDRRTLRDVDRPSDL